MNLRHTLRVLFVEDRAEDMELAQRALRAHGLEHVARRVADREALSESLEEFAPDVVISDFSLPGFGGLEALDIVRAHAADTPFLFLSGTIGEERAIEALRHGASDYVLKDKPRRLGPAVEHALQAGQERSARLAAESRVRAIVETTGEWFWEIDAGHRLTFTSPAVQPLLGRTVDEVLGADALGSVHPDDQPEARRTLTQHRAEKSGWRDWVLRHLHADGRVRWLESRAVPVLGTDQQMLGWRGSMRDVTDRVLQEQQTRRLARIEAVLSAINAIVVRERDRDTLFREACRIAVELGQLRVAWVASVEPPSGRLDLLAHHGADTTYIEPFRQAIVDGSGRETTTARAVRTGRPQVNNQVSFDPAYGVPRDDYDRLGVRAAMSLPLQRDGVTFGVLVLYAAEPEYFGIEEVALFERMADDIAFAVAFIERDERIAYLAYHDPLTGLRNRAALLEELENLAGITHALAVLDVVGLRAVNDARGRGVGDAVLREVGRTLSARVGTGGLVARLGGDQFAVLLRDPPGDGQLRPVLRDLMGDDAGLVLEALEPPVTIALRGGCAVAPRHGRSSDTLLSAAETALAGAKASRATLEVYRAELAERARLRRGLEQRLRLAVERREFVVHHQPKLKVEGSRVTGTEALVRWADPERGDVPPARFVSVLEETGLVGVMGLQVLEQALADVARWRAADLGVGRVAVNVAASQLRDKRFVTDVEAALATAGVPPGALGLELTESSVMDDPQRAAVTLRELRELGVEVAIDDFGTGYSSLAYLMRLPVTALKLDRSFIEAVTHEPQATALVTLMINLAQAMRIRTIAEGVETEAQWNLLRLLRCDEAQGYLFSKPLSAPDFEAWIRARS